MEGGLLSRRDDNVDRPWQEPEDGDPGDPLRGAGRLGGDWAGARPRFDDPMTWSIPLMRVKRIDVRVHLLFVIFVLVEIIQAWALLPTRGQGSTFGPELVLILVVCLFWSVLLHEFGHCVAARATGGEADEILMWPLGGLAQCRPAPTWSAHFITVAGGPLVNLAIVAITAPVLGVLTGVWWGVAIPSPLGFDGYAAVGHSWGLTVLYLLVWINVVLILFNLLPLFPLDGGRLVQAILWPRMGYARAMRLAVRAGYIGAIALGIFSLVRNDTMLIAVAIFGGLVCAQTMQKLDFTQQVLGFEPGPEGTLEPVPDPDAVRREQERQRQESEAVELDRILNKINQSGLQSLSARERRLLKAATERRRRATDESR